MKQYKTRKIKIKLIIYIKYKKKKYKILINDLNQKSFKILKENYITWIIWILYSKKKRLLIYTN